MFQLHSFFILYINYLICLNYSLFICIFLMKTFFEDINNFQDLYMI